MTIARKAARFVGSLLFVATATSCIPSTIGVAASGGGGGGGASGGEPLRATPLLGTLALSVGELAPPFDANVTDYTASVGFLCSRVRVNAGAADPSLIVRVNGLPIGASKQSEPLGLSAASNTLVVDVDNGRDKKTYRIVVNRASVAGLTQADPIPVPPDPHSGDFIGYSVAVEGNTLVVGSPGEDGTSQGTGGDPSLVNSATHDASGAVYVFRRTGVGSPWLFEAYLKASNNFPTSPFGDGFGSSVSISGNTIAVGAPTEDSSGTGVGTSGVDNLAVDSGAVYVFVRTGATWTQQAYIKASNTGIRDLFGASVSISGDTLMVGASLEDNLDGSQNDGPAGENTNAGAVYVFERSGQVWTQRAYLKAGGSEPVTAGDAFGSSVAVSGDVAVIGALGEDSVNPESGAAYVFRRVGGSWQQEAVLKASNAGSNDLLGSAVAIDGDRLVVGASGEDGAGTGVGSDGSTNSASDAGAAYVFARVGSGWVEEAYLKATNTRALANFGGSLAIRGDVVVVSALREDGGSAGVFAADALAFQGPGPLATGAAYVYVRNAGSWSPAAYVKATPVTAGSLFGVGVALDDATLVVGAMAADSSVAGSGAAFTFR